MKLLKKFTSIAFLFIFFTSAYAADENIEMLNQLGNESMVYSKKIVNLTYT